MEVTSKNVRQELKYRIAGLLPYLEMNITNEVEGFVAIQTQLNEQIVDVMGKIRSRKTRKENEKKRSEVETVAN